MINKNNYEIWLMDYLDGKLGDAEIGDLMLFLDQNPEIKIELENLDEMVLEKEEIRPTFNKSSLKKPLFNETKASHNPLLVGAVENTLSSKQKEKLKHAMAAYPELNNELQLFEKTRIAPDLTVVYPNTHELKKTIPLIAFSYSVWVQLAAALILVSSIGWFLLKQSGVITHDTIAENRPKPALQNQKTQQKNAPKISLKNHKSNQEKNNVSKQPYDVDATIEPMPGLDNKMLIQSNSQRNNELRHVMITPKTGLITRPENVLKVVGMPEHLNPIAYLQKPENKDEFIALPDLIYAEVKTQKQKVLKENKASDKFKAEDAGWLALAFINKITRANIQVVLNYNHQGKREGIDISTNGFSFQMGKKTNKTINPM